MTTNTDRITIGLAKMRAATIIDCAILRVRLHDDPEGLRTVDALDRRIKDLAECVTSSTETMVEILDDIARHEEHTA